MPVTMLSDDLPNTEEVDPTTFDGPGVGAEPSAARLGPGPRLLRAASTMAVATAVSRLTGGLKTAVLAAAIGIGLVGDAYTVANNLPNIVYELLIGGILTSVVVPLLVRAQHQDADGGQAYAQRLFTVITVLVVAVTALAVVAAPLLTSVYGIRGDPDQVALATTLARILLVEIIFYGVGAAATAILNTRHVFGAPAWAPVLNNVVVVAVAAVFIAVRGTGPLTPSTISNGEVLLLGVGTTMGIVVQALILLPLLHKAGVPLKLRWDWRGTGLGEIGRIGTWVLGYVALSTVSLAIITNVANRAAAEGGLGPNAFANANLLFQLPYGVLGVALLTALHPRMSRAAAAGDNPALISDLSLGARLTGMGLLPVSALFVAFGPQIATVVFGYGQVSVDQARVVGTTLALSAIGLVPFAITLLQLRVFYALTDARTPTLLNLAMVSVRIPAALLVPVLVEPQSVVPALGLVNAMSFVVGALIGQILLRRRLGHVQSVRILRLLGIVGVASLIAVGIAYVLTDLLLPAPTGAGTSLLQVLVGSVVAGGLLVVGLWVIRLPDVRETVAGMRRRTGGGA